VIYAHEKDEAGGNFTTLLSVLGLPFSAMTAVLAGQQQGWVNYLEKTEKEKLKEKLDNTGSLGKCLLKP